MLIDLHIDFGKPLATWFIRQSKLQHNESLWGKRCVFDQSSSIRWKMRHVCTASMWLHFSGVNVYLHVMWFQFTKHLLNIETKTVFQWLIFVNHFEMVNCLFIFSLLFFLFIPFVTLQIVYWLHSAHIRLIFINLVIISTYNKQFEARMRPMYSIHFLAQSNRFNRKWNKFWALLSPAHHLHCGYEVATPHTLYPVPSRHRKPIINVAHRLKWFYLKCSLSFGENRNAHFQSLSKVIK